MYGDESCFTNVCSFSPLWNSMSGENLDSQVKFKIYTKNIALAWFKPNLSYVINKTYIFKWKDSFWKVFFCKSGDCPFDKSEKKTFIIIASDNDSFKPNTGFTTEK